MGNESYISVAMHDVLAFVYSLCRESTRYLRQRHNTVGGHTCSGKEQADLYRSSLELRCCDIRGLCARRSMHASGRYPIAEVKPGDQVSRTRYMCLVASTKKDHCGLFGLARLAFKAPECSKRQNKRQSPSNPPCRAIPMPWILCMYSTKEDMFETG
jgi:hypothetical protein